MQSILAHDGSGHSREYLTRKAPAQPALDDVPVVFIVDGDIAARQSLQRLITAAGWELGCAARAVASAEVFLESGAVGETSCLLLDIAMAGMSGLDLRQELRRRRHDIPIVFITAQSDDMLRPRLLAGGAVECLLKPFSEAALLDALGRALRTR